MIPRNHNFPGTLLVLLVITTMLAVAAPAQDDTLRIEIVRSNVRIPIAVPLLEFDRQAGAADVAREIAEIVREDLRTVPMFNLADNLVYSRVGTHSHTNIGAIPFDRYAEYRIDALVLGKVTTGGTANNRTFRIETRLFSIQDRSSLFGKAITGTPAQIRQIGHTISANILYHFTGSFGVFRSKIYYSSTQELTNTENSEIWSMDFDGENQRRLTYSNSLKLFPAVGPKGTGLVYTSFINNNADVYLIRAQGGDAQTVFSSPAADLTPALSPDGNKVAFASSVAQGNMDIYVSNLDGSLMRRLTTHRAIDSSPCWSPDGSQISFTSGRSGSVQIYVMNSDGSNQRRITYDGRYNDGADWSPDGRLIAYSSRRTGSLTFDVKMHDLTTSQTYWVTRDVENDENPTFSPDGQQIAFASDRTGRYQIWIVGIDGSGMRQLTVNGENKHPSWTK